MLHRRKFNKRVYIFSNDKDLLQVATDPRTYCVIPDRKKGGNLYLDRDDIVERYGMTPDQVCLTKALAGDSSDNYKGLHMVGPVKALAYISRGVNPAFKYFRSHPKSVQEEFPFLEEEWNTVHTCYLLAKIPTTSKYPYFLPGFGVMAQARMVDVVRNRRRRMSQKNYNIRKRKFERLCVTHGMKMLLARRNELFRGIEIEG
jgi:5'-3' exonuclease